MLDYVKKLVEFFGVRVVFGGRELNEGEYNIFL